MATRDILICLTSGALSRIIEEMCSSMSTTLTYAFWTMTEKDWQQLSIACAALLFILQLHTT